MKFIELHQRKIPFLVNVATIGKVRVTEDGKAFINFAGNDYAVETDESYEQVKALILRGAK